jgi:photosystem II stability/assembly factor-like uncharacterized protein
VGSNRTGGVAASTTDGGSHWRVVQLFPIVELTSVSCVRAGDCWAGGYRISNRGHQSATIVASSDSGHSWHSQDVPGRAVALGSISCAGKGHCSAGGGTADGPSGHGFMLRTDNGGAHWFRQRLPRGIRTIEAVGCRSTKACSAGGLARSGRGVIVSTGDRGRHWRRRAVPRGVAEIAYIACAGSRCVGVARKGSGSNTVVLAR